MIRLEDAGSGAGERAEAPWAKGMRIELPQKVTYILRELGRHGYEAYAVGGCVRDSVLGRVPKDWDITTSARPDEVKAVFCRTIDTGIAHGTVTVMVEHEGFEVTTYRIDGEYEDARHPKEVTFTPLLCEDLRRRDFTINAMACNETDGLVDEFGGLQDLRRGVIRCVGRPKERFAEDALRMLRAVRFAAQLDFEIEPETKAAAAGLARNLARVSAERIQAELVKLLVSGHPEKLAEAYETGLTGVFLPEFDVMMRTGQNNPHHCCSVGEHTIRALTFVPADKVLRLTMLLHDVAKPLCRTVDGDGVDHFYGHQAAGSELARKILRRLKFDNDTTDRVCSLIRWHDDSPPLSRRNVRRAVNRIGTEQYPRFFAVRRADILAQSGFRREEKLAYIASYEAAYEDIIKNRECLSVKQLAVNGRDLIAAGMQPGREIGEMLRELLELVLDSPEKNTKERLLAEVSARQSGKGQTASAAPEPPHFL